MIKDSQRWQNIKNKAVIGITAIITKIVFITGVLIPLFFTGCNKPDPVPPVVKSLDQSVVMQYTSEPELVYSASISNVENAVLKISRDDELILNETSRTRRQWYW
jgi:hypothetical protein